MYDNVSQKLKSFTKVLTIILLVLIPAGGITGGIFCFWQRRRSGM
ncbi:MAG: hypothetical protein V8S89_07575 [Oscillospiraceae bacterium]